MHKEKPAATRGLPVWAVVVGGMALAVSCALAAILGVSDLLPGEVMKALGPVERVEQRTEDGGLIIIHVTLRRRAWRPASALAC